ncbi:MAG: hypothetical protein ACKOOE_04625 [Micrococcales bacterium]
MIEIKWNDLIMVAGASIGATALVVSLFAIGVRLLTNAQHVVAGKGKDKQKSITKEIAFRLSALISFALASSVMVYGLYIIVTFSKLQK